MGLTLSQRHTVRCCQSWVAPSWLTAHGYISVLDSCLLNVFRLLITTTTTATTTAFLHLRQQVTQHRLYQAGKRLLKQCLDSRSVDGVLDRPLNSHFAMNSTCLINIFMKSIMYVVCSPPPCKHIFNFSTFSLPLLSSLPP